MENIVNMMAQSVSSKTCKKARPQVVFLSDFGQTDAVATCHSMMQKVARGRLQIMDLNHNINPFSVSHASIVLRRSRDFCDKTVFVAVVDPGVGSNRKPIILKTASRELYFVGPNNGIFTDVAQIYGIDSVYEIDKSKVNPDWMSGTFDGRDLYSPAASMVAVTKGKAIEYIAKKIDKSEFLMLETASRVVINKDTITAKVIAIDEPYGNVWTQISLADMEKIGIKKGDIISVKFNGRTINIPFVHSFSNVKPQDSVIYLDSRGNSITEGFAALAINQGDFRKKYGITNGLKLQIKKAPKQKKAVDNSIFILSSLE